MRVVCVNKERESVYIAHSCACVERERERLFISHILEDLCLGLHPMKHSRYVSGECVCVEREKKSQTDDIKCSSKTCDLTCQVFNVV